MVAKQKGGPLCRLVTVKVGRGIHDMDNYLWRLVGGVFNGRIVSWGINTGHSGRITKTAHRMDHERGLPEGSRGSPTGRITKMAYGTGRITMIAYRKDHKDTAVV